MRIGIDIDGVIADTFTLLVQELNQYFNKNLTYDDIVCYDIAAVYNLKKEQLAEFAQLKIPLLQDNSVPIPLAAECINNLRDRAYVALISARFEQSRDRTQNWLRRHGIQWDDLILLGNHDKAETCVNQKLDYFIEDNLNNALQVSEIGIPVLLLDAPYNRASLPDLVQRVFSWPQICEVFTKS